MTNDELITELYKIGKLPAETNPESDAFPLDVFDGYLQQFAVPISVEQAKLLINLSTPIDTGCYGIEWALLHLIETVEIEKLQEVLDFSEENELKNIIQIRLNNYNRKNNGKN